MGRMLLAWSLLAVSPTLAWAQIREVLVVFKDGFSVKGKVIQQRTTIVDPQSGQSFPVPKDGSFMYLDDDVRTFHFSPYQIQEAIQSKAGETRRDLITIHKQDPIRTRKNVFLSGWSFKSATDWNDRWERTFTIDTGRGSVEMRQRIIHMTPWQTHMMGVEYLIDQQFLTKELGAPFVLDMLSKHYAAQKEMKEPERRFKIAQFMFQAGFYGVALDELEKLVKEHSEAKASADPMIDQLRKLRSNLYVDDIERCHRIGRHDEAQNRIAGFDNQDLRTHAGEKQKIAVQDLKTKYEAAKEKLQQAKQYLKELPTKLNVANRPFWSVATSTVAEELTFDTLPRLDTFLTFAQQHLRELKDNAKPAQTTEEVLAIAASGWLQGNSLAEPDVKNAAKLFQARLMLQEYLKTDDSVAREKLVARFTRDNDLPVDVIARIIRQMPPIMPYDKITTDQIRLDIEAPDSSGGSYIVQLPPEYNPSRSYPVVMLLHSAREKAAILLERWKEMAATHGYILAAPLWAGKAAQVSYKYSAHEHALALDSLRDLRRRFNVDSDRVFLFGWEDGGTMAFDLGLAHPDQFAGVLPMNGNCAKFASRCWSNGQYLPFYVVDGESNGNHPKQNRALFKDWIRGNYPSIYVEYKGRASEWYAWEIPTMFEWMNKKKRHLPMRELGRAHTTTPGLGEEFRTLRHSDNKFYWVGTSSIDERCITDGNSFDKSTRPATMTATISVGNEAGGKTAKIWNQVNVRSSGLKQVSIWLAPHMIDFTKPVVIRVNAVQHGNQRTIIPSLGTMLEEWYQSGDRDRLFYAKIDVKL